MEQIKEQMQMNEVEKHTLSVEDQKPGFVDDTKELILT